MTSLTLLLISYTVFGVLSFIFYHRVIRHDQESSAEAAFNGMLFLSLWPLALIIFLLVWLYFFIIELGDKIKNF